MTLGLPAHLARDSLSRALATAGHCAAFVELGVGIAVAVIMAVLGVTPNGWLGAALIVLMVALLALVARRPTVTSTVVYLVVGTGVIIVLTALVMHPEVGFESTNNAMLAPTRIALLLVGGAGAGSAVAITWATLGWGLGEAAAFLGAAIAGGVYAPNFAATMAFAIVVIARVLDGVTRRRNRRGQAGLHRASQQMRELGIRHDYELRATARLHDTALSHLVAIAAAGSGPVDERLRVSIRQDLDLIVGRDWTIDHAMNPGGVAAVEPGRRDARGASVDDTMVDDTMVDDTTPVLVSSFAAAASSGLRVRVTGDTSVLGTIGPRRAAALDAAVAQCLINVARHAGVDEAELALGAGGGEVSVAVMDSGAGFDEREVPEDRIGLRTSIRARIELEHGTVRLWSTKGVGTTIVLTVPEGGA